MSTKHTPGPWLPMRTAPKDGTATPVQALAKITADDLWRNEAVMALNAELGLTMDQLLRFVHALAASPAAPVQPAAPVVSKRARFEAWVSAERPSLLRHAITYPDMVYLVAEAIAWDAWQAALVTPPEAAPVQEATPVVSERDDEQAFKDNAVVSFIAAIGMGMALSVSDRNKAQQAAEYLRQRLSTTPGAKQ